MSPAEEQFQKERIVFEASNFSKGYVSFRWGYKSPYFGSVDSMAMAFDANGRFLYIGFRRHPMPSHVVSQLIKILQDLDSNSLTKEFFQKKTHLKWFSISTFRWISHLSTLRLSSKTTRPCSWLLSVHEVGCWPSYGFHGQGEKGQKHSNNFRERNDDGDVKGKRKGLTSVLFHNLLFTSLWLYIVSFLLQPLITRFL